MVRALLSFVFALVSTVSLAAITPTVTYGPFGNPSFGGEYSSAAASCNEFQIRQGHLGVTSIVSLVSRTPSEETWRCDVMNPSVGNGYVMLSGPASSQSCPAHSVLSGASCACDSGYTESSGQCINATGEAKCTNAKGASDMFTGHSAKPPVGQAYCPSSGNADGCAAVVEGGFAGKKAGQPLVWTYEIKYTGAKCTPPASSETTAPTTCKGQQGTFNGKVMCIPYGPADSVSSVKSETRTNPVAPGAESGSGGGTTTTQDTSCSGSKCTTTTTKTTTDPSGVATTTTETKDQPKEDFCKDNPRSVACKEFNFGDVDAQEVGNENVQLGIVKEPGFGPASGTCPSPKVATVLGISLVMPYTLLCEFAERIKPLLIGFAYLSAALTFFGFARK